MSTQYHYSRYRGYGLRFAVYGCGVDVFIGDISAGNDTVICGSFPTLDAACDYIDDMIGDTNVKV